jgi:hypothetical protein
VSRSQQERLEVVGVVFLNCRALECSCLASQISAARHAAETRSRRGSGGGGADEDEGVEKDVALLLLHEAATWALTLFVLVSLGLTLLGIVQGGSGYHIRSVNESLGKCTRLRANFGTPVIVA